MGSSANADSASRLPIILAGKDDRHGKPAPENRGVCSSDSHYWQARRFSMSRVEPTRELAAQVENRIRDYGRFTDLCTPWCMAALDIKQRERSNAVSIFLRHAGAIARSIDSAR
jgi:hypothetical protein